MVVWDPRRPLGGNSVEALRRARLILWRGWCSVHARFTVGQIEKARRDHPGITVIVHPECRFEVAQKADAIGSTEGILKAVRESPAGTRWAVGTELNMVTRLAREMAPGKEVVSLDDCFCVCSTMARIDPPHLLWILEGLVSSEVRNAVRVPEDVARGARVGLDRMLGIT